MRGVDVALPERLSEAVSFFWRTREAQTKSQKVRGVRDQGTRGAVTGGRQMDGFVSLITDLVVSAGLDRKHVHFNSKLELPGYFRAEKKWDLLLVKDGQLLAAIEAKSQVGPSFGNNFNNRTEEAIGSVLDLWTAYREGAFKKSPEPWLGYVFLLEDCPRSRKPVKVVEPHFEVFPDFKSASYAGRYEILCRKLMLERHYRVTAFLTSSRETGLKGICNEPADDLTFERFARSLVAHVSAAGSKG